MPKHLPHRVHSIPVQQPLDPDEGNLPPEPDEGLVPPMIPDDPEYDRMVEPED
jgi:hypothetical protein